MRLAGRGGSLLLSALLPVLVGCAPVAPRAPAPGVGAPDAGPRAEAPKTLTIGQPNPIRGFAPWYVTGSQRVHQYRDLHSNMLVSTDERGNLVGRMAARLPSLEDGTIVMLPDGRMQTIWNLRADVKWHDGASFTAQDVVFGWQVAAHPEIPLQRQAVFLEIELIEATNPSTVVMTHRRPFFKALELGPRELSPLPRHLLGDAFQGDKEAFLNLPFWTTDYVHTGPFQVADFGFGEHVVLERFDGYFLGRPRLNTVVIRIIGDDNAMLSNILAGAVDISGELKVELVATLRDRWKQDGGGFLVTQQGTWRFISVQFHPEWGEPRELQTDARIRRGLLIAIDRDTIRQVVAPGFPDTEADAFVVKNSPWAADAGRPFARFRYDPVAAVRDLSDGGWGRRPDGRMVNQSGSQVRLSLRTSRAYETELGAIADHWRELGIDVTEDISRGPAGDAEYNARFPSMEITAQGNNETVLRRFDSRSQPLPENRYVGSNAGHYANPAFDRLLDRLYGTMDVRQQGLLLRELGEILAADLPALPMYYTVDAVVALKHVRALDDYAGANRMGTTARNAHLWDRN